MNDRRTLDRIKPFYYLRLYEETSQEYVGSVFDISRGGMRILSDWTFEKGKCYRFVMLLPEDSILGESIPLAAKNAWADKNSEDGAREAGFEFTGEVSEGIHVIGKLISDLKEQHLL